jgi:hypothetical protein
MNVKIALLGTPDRLSFVQRRKTVQQNDQVVPYPKVRRLLAAFNRRSRSQTCIRLPRAAAPSGAANDVSFHSASSRAMLLAQASISVQSRKSPSGSIVRAAGSFLIARSESPSLPGSRAPKKTR